MSLLTSFLNSLNTLPICNSNNISSIEDALIVTIPITLEINVKIFQGTHGRFYCIEHKGQNNDSAFPIYYDIHFPLNWVFNEEFKSYPYSKNLDLDSLTGPNHCSNCKYFGYYNGVFIGYCLNCASEFSNFRGNGLTDKEGIELNENMVAFDLTYFQKENSMWNTYLKGVSLEQIGDVHLKEEYELYKDLPDLIPMDQDGAEKEKKEELKKLDLNIKYSDSDSNYDFESGDEWEQNQIDKLIDRF